MGFYDVKNLKACLWFFFFPDPFPQNKAEEPRTEVGRTASAQPAGQEAQQEVQ